MADPFTTHDVDLAHCRECIVMDFEKTADWRRRIASEHPDDERNLVAAELLERLATTVKDVPDDVVRLYGLIFIDDDVSFQASERNSEALRAIGFHSEPEDATAFVKAFVDNYS